MNTQISEEQSLLKDTVARFCESEVPLDKVRTMIDDPVGLTPALWQTIADQGWLGLLIPEADGGLGLGVTDLGIVCEEMGRFVTPGPFLSTVLAAHAIAIGGSSAAKSAWLEKVVSGKAKGAIALLETDAQLGPDYVKAAAMPSAGGFTLNGKKCFVSDLAAADFIVVAARTPDGVSLFVVEAGAKGVSKAVNKLTDLTSRSGQLTLHNITVDADALIGEQGHGWEIVERVLQVANVCIAAESVAGSEHILKLTVNYAKERTQFGKLIGSFQAVKHPLANLFVDIESARSAYHYAAWAVDAQAEDVAAAVATARVTATEAYRRTTMDCLQAHGGIAFTWEYDLHLFFKRAKHNQYLYGMPRDYEEIIAAEALGI